MAEGVSKLHLPRRTGETDPFLEAWMRATDGEELVELLQAGSNLGLFEFKRQRWKEPHEPAGHDLLWLWMAEDRLFKVEFDSRAEELRRLLPPIPPYEQWAEAVARKRSAAEPIELLVGDLEAGEAPTCTQQALVEAWRNCRNGVVMKELLHRLGDPASRPRIESAYQRGMKAALLVCEKDFAENGRREFHMGGPYISQLIPEHTATTLREEFPEPPTLRT